MKPTIYDTWVKDGELKEKLTLIQGWARDGLILEQIAHNLGVSRSVFFKMKKKYKDVAEAIKKGKEVVDIEVENALLKRAIGYDYEEVKTYIQENSGKVTKRKEVTVKHIAGDVTAQMFWLQNRKNDKWKDRRYDNTAEITQEDKLKDFFDKLETAIKND